MSRRRAFALIAALYLLACAVTVGTTRHPLRPLYEGVGPAVPYRWVNPPRDFKSTNVAPFPITVSIDLTSTGSPAAGVASGDGQLVLSMPAGAIPPSPPSTAATVAINPLDPATLGPLPPGLYADGNVYEVTVSYQPRHQPLKAAARPVDAVVTTPAPAHTVLQSSDGRTWIPIPTHHIPREAAVATTFSKFGYLLAAASTPVVVKPPGSSGVGDVILPAVLGAIAVALVIAAVVLRRRRSRPS